MMTKKSPADGPRLKDKVDGILLINKARGPSSNAVLQRIKFLLGAKKAGHTGSLDPMATGMLPICFGEATKISQYLLDADKSYRATGLLGIQTDTSDAMGVVTSEIKNFKISESTLRQVLDQFKGSIQQVPSMYSALKHEGRPLYHYARKGIDIERKARDITIHQLELNQFDGQSFYITVHCSKGSYIRNLVEDIGVALGVGAHVTELHRISTAGFDNERMFTLEEIEQLSLEERRALLLPLDRAIQYLPKLLLSDIQVQHLRQGKTVHIPSSNLLPIVRLYDSHNQFIGLGDWLSPTELKVKRLLSLEV